MQIQLVSKPTPVRRRQRWQVRVVEEQNGKTLLSSEKLANYGYAAELIATLKAKLPKAEVVEVDG